ncbi:hypothetical protein NM208_g4314 [Fusarium decemcellulare]|uniref:Uncharacterized protein n=1 Tax=Fusarium decemcellulare TaxID=57161 RepID=A0ACC1SL20_9HYPO|nr:hypothetical protein NM208_g4314 [Fusarium decemcellulare]
MSVGEVTPDQGPQPASTSPEQQTSNNTNPPKTENTNSAGAPAAQVNINPDSTAGNTEPNQNNDTSAAKAKDANSRWIQRIESEGFSNFVTYEWLKDVNTRIAVLESSTDNKDEKKDAEEKNDDEQLEGIMMQPKVRDCNWEQFKNRYSAEECTFAIETLLASEDLENQMRDEQLRRLPAESRKDLFEENRDKRPRRGRTDKNAKAPRMERVRINSPALMRFLRKTIGETSWSTKPHTFLKPFKLLTHFHDKMEKEFQTLQEAFQSQAPGEGDLAGSVQSPVEKAPKPLVESVALSPTQKESKEQNPCDESEDLKNIKQETPHADGSKSPTSFQHDVAATEKASSMTEHNDTAIPDEDDSPELEVFSRDEFEVIKCFMDFARIRLLKPYHKFDHLDHSHQAKVRYDDLRSLFRPEELIFQRDDPKLKSSRLDVDSRRSVPGTLGGPKLFRVFFVSVEEFEWRVDNLENQEEGISLHKPAEADPIKVQAYYIDFDGTSYAGVSRQWTISRFRGEKEVTKLEIYPARFHKNSEKHIQSFQKRGERFRDLLRQPHLAVEHDGWTLTHDPVGETIHDYSREERAEYIDSDVIIDFQEAYQTMPAWKPSFEQYITSTFEPNTEYDEFAVIQWSGSDRPSSINKFREVVVEFDSVGALEWNNMAETDNFIVDSTTRTIETDASKQKLTPEDLSLLPSRLFVYSLRHRKFVNADIENLKQPPVMSNPFDELKISTPHKQLIRSVVQDHFDKKSIQRELQTEGLEPMEQDFIRGKGKGLVILLHGAPGVGKTATAEAVAYAHRKPLFPITCGDLGIDPIIVESSLSRIFRLANLWDCVLLLDEAEIFLSQREKKDDNLQRNALVSIFLRTLEYYPGILFLTTNRVGVLDEALNSRVHVSISFPYLNLDQTVALFEMNLKRSGMIADQRVARTKQPKISIRSHEIIEFAKFHYNNRPNKSSPWWNGRQIRNAFQIATSLAYVDNPDDSDDSTRYLGRYHFDKVLGLIRDYEQYRESLFQKTDNELAEHREERTHVAGNFYARQDTRGYDLTPDPYRPRPYTPQHLPSFSGSVSNARATPDRHEEFDYMTQEPRAYASTPHRREPSHSPMYSPYSGAGVEQRPSRGEWDPRDMDHYGNPLQRMR